MLKQNLTAPFDDTSELRILVIATGIPENVGGTPIRNYFILKSICDLPGATVDLFCLCVEEDMSVKKRQLEDDLPVAVHFVKYRKGTLLTRLCALLISRMQPHMVTYRTRTRLGRDVWQYCRQLPVDVIHIEQLDTYYCIEPYIKRLRAMGVKIVLDAHNIETEVLRSANHLRKFPISVLVTSMVRSLQRLERRAARMCDAILTCSEIDAAWFRQARKNGDAVYVVPNGVDCDYFKQHIRNHANALIFIGSPGYPPNADALDFYLTTIHPQIKLAVPEIKLYIIGRDSDEWLAKRSDARDDSVVATGFAHDIREYLNVASVGICPVRAGSGTRLKVLTYMSAGLPVVSTTKGIEGIDYSPGEAIVVDQPDEFAQEIINLLRNNAARKRIGKRGRKLVQRSYDWSKISGICQQYYVKILK